MDNTFLEDILKKNRISYIKHFKQEQSFNEYNIELEVINNNYPNGKIHCLNLANNIIYSVLNDQPEINIYKTFKIKSISLLINNDKYIHNLNYLTSDESIFFIEDKSNMIYFSSKSIIKQLFKSILNNNSLPIKKIVSNECFSVTGKFIITSDKELRFKYIEFFRDYFILNNITYSLCRHNSITAVVKALKNEFTIKFVSYDYEKNIILTIFNNNTKKQEYRFSLKEIK